MSDAVPKPEAAADPAALTALKLFASAYRVELILFVVTAAMLSSFSGNRFLRQSGAPHFVYQAKAWLEGRTDIDPTVLPNLEDWACVRELNGQKTRCEGRPMPTDKWYVSFPSFPAAVMLPFVALHGYQFNDTSFGVLVGALAVALFYSLLRHLKQFEGLDRTDGEATALSALLCFGTVFFYCAIRGEVWFSAEVMGVAFTCLYVRSAVGAARPRLAGLFFAMAVLTRTPLLFSGVFFLLEAACPTAGKRKEELNLVWKTPAAFLEKVKQFAIGAGPLAVAHAAYNQMRFGSAAEFGHKFLFNNRVNADIDTYGLFHPHYLQRNLEAAFLKFPKWTTSPPTLSYDPNGLTLALTLPILVFLLMPKQQTRLHWPLWLTVAACAIPGLLYQNNGYMQFGFRFSLDYTPYLLLLFAISGWSLKNRAVQAVWALGVVVNFWGAVAFRGYTEFLRGG